MISSYLRLLESRSQWDGFLRQQCQVIYLDLFNPMVSCLYLLWMPRAARSLCRKFLFHYTFPRVVEVPLQHFKSVLAEKGFEPLGPRDLALFCSGMWFQACRIRRHNLRLQCLKLLNDISVIYSVQDNRHHWLTVVHA